MKIAFEPRLKITALLCSLFFASGASALIFETLWFRQAGLAFGNSVWASSLVLSGFMAGLALGNALAARYGDRFGNPVRTFAIAELAIGLTGVGLVYLFPLLGAAFAPWLRPLLDQPWVLNPIRLLMAFLLLVIPSTAMGVTLPLFTKALTGSDPNFGRVLGRLYGWNTLGAVIGVVFGETVLIGAFGLRGTALAAGGLNLAAAATALSLSTQIPRTSPAPSRKVKPAVHPTERKQWLVAAFLSGFCLLALEVVWFRLLLLFMDGLSITFALMLAVVLAGIALGGLSASRWLCSVPGADRFSGPIALTAGVLCVVSYAAFPWFLHPAATADYRQPIEILRLSTPLMFPVSFLSGVFFTLVGAALRNLLSSETQTTGVLTLANTAGAALGSLIAGFLFLPVLGIERSSFLIAVLYGGIGALLLFNGRAPRWMAYSSAAVFLLSALLFPFGWMERQFFQASTQRYLQEDSAAEVAAVREGLTETIIYTKSMMLGKPLFYRLLTNSFSMSGTSFKSRRYQKLYVYWPMAIHPNLKRALLIAYGAGNTAKAMTDSRSLETIDIVDSSRDILEMNRTVYPDETDWPLGDSRVRVHIEDGRYFLQTTAQRFDLITGEPPPPWAAGVVTLYTREYFQLLHDRLAEGGIATYWLPVRELTEISNKAILRAFCDVFEDCSLWNGAGYDLMMVGTRNARGPVSERHFIQQWLDPSVAVEMRRLGFERPEQLGALFIGDAVYLKELTADSPRMVDNDPKLIDTPGSVEATERLLRSLADTPAARERFQSSPLIQRLWPEQLRAASLPYFEFQDLINGYLYETREARMEDVHRILTQSSLVAPVLWLLTSSPDIQTVVADATPEELALPAVQFQLGIRLVSEQQFDAAVEPLRRAEQLPELGEGAFGLHLYALCMSGRKDQAQRLAQDRWAQYFSKEGLSAGSLSETFLPPFWLWMKKTCGVDPLAGAQAPQN